MSDSSSPGSGASLGVGSIVSESFSLAFANFLKLLAVIVVPYIIMGIVAFLLLGQMFDPSVMANPAAMNQLMADPSFLAMYFLFILIAFFISSFMVGAGTQIFFDAKTGGRAGLGAAFSVGFKRAVQLFVSMLVLYIGMVIVFFLISLVLGLIVGATGAPALSVVMGIIILVLALWFVGCILPFGPIVVLENRWISAIGRSFALTKGYRWSNVLLLVLFSLASIVVYLIIGLIFYVTTLLGTVGIVIGAIVGLIGLVVLFGAGIGMATLDFARLREIKEGTSLSSLADVFD